MREILPNKWVSNFYLDGRSPWKVISSAIKVSRRAYDTYENTGKLDAKTLKDAGIDELVSMDDDVNTIFGSQSSYLDKIAAATDLIVGTELNSRKYVAKRVDSLEPGPFAEESIPARGPNRDFTRAERDQINDIGQKHGCHTCGTKDPGTKSGDFVLDHQPPNKLRTNKEPQILLPHCKSCSLRQGGQVRQSTP